jgi:ABC-2 type transport system ATP-binding protein
VELHPGQVTALVGPNGAGKTTVLRLAAGTLRPWGGLVAHRSGRVSWSVRARRGRDGRTAFLPDHVELPRDQTLARFLRYGAFLAGLTRERAEAAIGAAARDVLLAGALRRPLGELSRGMARRAALAFVLLERPSVLLLDEPWAGLDPHSSRLLREVIRGEAERGTLVVASSHELDQVAPLADRVLLLEAGCLVADLAGPMEVTALARRVTGGGS